MASEEFDFVPQDGPFVLDRARPINPSVARANSHVAVRRVRHDDPTTRPSHSHAEIGLIAPIIAAESFVELAAVRKAATHDEISIDPY